MKGYTFGFLLGTFTGMLLAIAIDYQMCAKAQTAVDLTHHDALARTQHAVTDLESLRYLPGQLGPLYRPPTVYLAYRSDSLFCSGVELY